MHGEREDRSANDAWGRGQYGGKNRLITQHLSTEQKANAEGTEAKTEIIRDDLLESKESTNDEKRKTTLFAHIFRRYDCRSNNQPRLKRPPKEREEKRRGKRLRGKRGDEGGEIL